MGKEGNPAVSHKKEPGVGRVDAVCSVIGMIKIACKNVHKFILFWNFEVHIIILGLQ